MNRLNKPTDDLPPFIDVKHALRSAYLSEVAEVWARTPDPQAFGTSREAESEADYSQAVWANNVMIENVADVMVRSHDDQILNSHRVDLRAPVLDDFDQFEWIGQGCWTLNMVRDLLPVRLLATVEARFTVLTPPSEHREPFGHALEDAQQEVLRLRKETACADLVTHLERAGTCGNPDPSYLREAVLAWAGLTELVDTEWSELSGINVRTLRRWRNGRTAYGPGIVSLLEEWLTEALELLHAPMFKAGLVRSHDPIRYTVYRYSTQAPPQAGPFSFQRVKHQSDADEVDPRVPGSSEQGTLGGRCA